MKILFIRTALVLVAILLILISLSAGSQGASCKATEPDMLGPFYKPGAPVRSSVGMGYVLKGTVKSSKNCSSTLLRTASSYPHPRIRQGIQDACHPALSGRREKRGSTRPGTGPFTVAHYLFFKIMAVDHHRGGGDDEIRGKMNRLTDS